MTPAGLPAVDVYSPDFAQDGLAARRPVETRFAEAGLEQRAVHARPACAIKREREGRQSRFATGVEWK